MNTAPSVERLCRAFPHINRPTARMIRTVIKAPHREALMTLIDVFDGDMLSKDRGPRFVGTRRWIARCHNPPLANELKLSMLNDLLEGYGVECDWGKGGQDVRRTPALEYVNMGDSYAATLCLFRGRIVLTTWADIVERHPKLFGWGGD